MSYFDGQVHFRSNGQSWRYQVDSSADQINPHAAGTDWFQNSFGERAWITISLDGRIIGAGHHGSNEQSHVACGIQLQFNQQHPRSVWPAQSPARVMQCVDQSASSAGMSTRNYFATLQIRNSALWVDSVSITGMAPPSIAVGAAALGEALFIQQPGGTPGPRVKLLGDGTPIEYVNGNSSPSHSFQTSCN